MHDRANPETLIALEPPTMPTMDLLPPPSIDPPAFPAPQRSTGSRIARLIRRLRGLRRRSTSR